MQVRIKKLNSDAVIPSYTQPGDAGMDLIAISRTEDQYKNIVYGTGLAIEIPDGYVGLIFPRSSNSKHDVYLTNHVGVIDSGYRGEIMFKFRLIKDWESGSTYNVGDRIGQLIILPYPLIKFIETTELSNSERGGGGFGSTGN